MESKGFNEEKNVQEIFSRTIRAGKRTYFFDVKCTRNNEYYLTITESKKKFIADGNFKYEKHKLFLYPEDFEKFTDTFHDVIDFIRENQPADQNEDVQVEDESTDAVNVEDEIPGSEFSKIEFEDI